MTPIEFLISSLSPHRCLVCEYEGLLVCNMCADTTFGRVQPVCYRCRSTSANSATCSRCTSHTPISNIWTSTYYDGTAKELLGLLKFHRAKAAAAVIATCIDKHLPPLPCSTLVSAVPTASVRVRRRGYDQSRLIARQLARLRKLTYRETLFRSGSSRQLGSSRSQRFRQLKSAYRARNPANLAGTTILLVDDVITTGATLEAAARVLHAAGSRTIFAAVFAQAKITTADRRSSQ